MKRKIFLDTNVFLDKLTEREPFNKSAAEILSLADRNIFEIYIFTIKILSHFNLHHRINLIS